MESNRNQNRKKLVPAALLAAGVLIGAVANNALADDSKPTPSTWAQVDKQLEQLAANNKAGKSELEETLNAVPSICLDKIGQETDGLRAKFNNASGTLSNDNEVFDFSSELASDGSIVETISSVNGDRSAYSLSVSRNPDGGVIKATLDHSGVTPVKTPPTMPGQTETKGPDSRPYSTSLSINLDGEMSYIDVEDRITEALFVDGHLDEDIDRPAQSQFDTLAHGIESLEQFLSRAQTAVEV